MTRMTRLSYPAATSLLTAVLAGAGCGGGSGAAGPGAGGTGGLGSAAPIVLASGERGAWAIAVDATSVYWTNQDARTVMKAPIDGGPPVVLATRPSAAQIPWDVTVAGGAVYWNDYASPGSVMTAPVAGGAAATVAAQQIGPRNLAVAGANVYWTNLWILGNESGAVMTAPLAGGAPVALASAQDDPNGIAADDTGVYWTNLGGTISKLPAGAGGGDAPVTLASAQPGPQHIVVDATNV
jgi:hypothetical protein